MYVCVITSDYIAVSTSVGVWTVSWRGCCTGSGVVRGLFGIGSSWLDCCRF